MKPVMPWQLKTWWTRCVLALAAPSPADLRRDQGQTLAEYALILALVAVAIVGALIFLRGKITGLFSNIGSQL